MWGVDCDILIADVEDLKLLWNCELDKVVSHLPAEIAVIFAAIEGEVPQKDLFGMSRILFYVDGRVDRHQ